MGQWYAPDPQGKVLIYWFVIDKNLDMPGMLYFRGPGPGGNVALVRETTRRGKKKNMFTPVTFSLIHATDFADRL